MPLFRYEGYLENSRLSGSIRGTSREEIVGRLRAKGLLVSKVDADTEGRAEAWRPSLSALGLFLGELATFIKSGHNLADSLETMLESRTGPQAGLTADLLDTIEGGMTLSQAMEKHEHCFPRYLSQGIKAGELSGDLGQALESCAGLVESRGAMFNRLLSAASYPLFISLVALFSALFLIARVMPVISRLYSDSGAPLPPLTRLLIALGNIGPEIWTSLALGLVILSVLLIRLFKKHYEFFEGLLLRMPGAGRLLLYSNLSLSMRTLSSLTNAGVNILDSLRAAADSSQSPMLRNALMRTIELVNGGAGLVDSFRASGALPPEISGLIRAGEKSKKLPETLLRAADLTEDRVSRATDTVIRLMEPALILLAGGLVGIVVAAILLPLFQANTLLGN